MLSPIVIWICFAIYIVFLLLIALGVTMKEKKQATTGSLLTATVKWPVLVMTYLASLMSTWVFFAGPGAYYRGGLGYWISELSYIALFPLIANFTMNKVWMMNQQYGNTFVTPADFYFARFQNKALRTIIGLIFLVSSIPYITSVIVAIANAAQYATGGTINYTLAVIVVGCAMTVFVMIGGMKSAATADTVQGLAFIALLWVIVIACLLVGFGSTGLTGAIETLASGTEEQQAFFSYPGPSGWVPYAGRFGYPFSCAIGWTIMLPHVFVRSGYFGDKLSAQRKLNYLTPILQVIVWTGTMLIGLTGLALFPGLETSQTELIIPYLVQNVIIDFNPTLATVLLVAFFFGACAVGMSTSNAFLGISSAIVSEDILKHTLNIKITKKNEMLFNRIIIAIIGFGSMALAINPPELIFTLIMFSIAIVMPLFPVLVMGIYWKRCTWQGALVASIVGAVVVLMCYFVPALSESTAFSGSTWYGFWGLLVAWILVIVVSLATKPDYEASREFYELLEGTKTRFYTMKTKKA